MGIFHREEQEYRISKLSGILSEDSTSLEDYIYNRPSKEDRYEIDDFDEDEILKKNKPQGVVIIYGFLKKQSKYMHVWKTRFLILTNHYLFAFTGVENDADCTMALHISNIISIEEIQGNNKEYYQFVIKSYGINYYFKAENAKIREVWMKYIKSFLKYNNGKLVSM